MLGPDVRIPKSIISDRGQPDMPQHTINPMSVLQRGSVQTRAPPESLFPELFSPDCPSPLASVLGTSHPAPAHVPCLHTWPHSLPICCSHLVRLPSIQSEIQSQCITWDLAVKAPELRILKCGDCGIGSCGTYLCLIFLFVTPFSPGCPVL